VAIGDWSERQLLALTAGVVAAILVTMAGLVLYVFMKYGELEDEIAKLNGEVSKLQREAETLEEKKKDLADAERRVPDDIRRLPDEEGTKDLIDQVSEQSKNARVKIEKGPDVVEKRVRRRKPGQARTKRSQTGYATVKMSLEGSGKFHDFGQFLNRLENRLERIVSVTGFELTANKDGMVPDDPRVGIKLEFEAYRYTVPAQKKPK
jgi:Tfp pilus assembly protein PilO